MGFAFTYPSRNKKTGPIPVTTSPRSTCPSCPLKGNGCYAESGPMAWFWHDLDSTGITWSHLVARVRALPSGTFWRHDQAGDLSPSAADTISTPRLAELVRANRNKRGHTFTHYPVIDHKGNADAIRDANAAGFTINLSANSLAHADALTDFGPVASVVPIKWQRRANESLTVYRRRIRGLRTPAGKPVTICPATYLDHINCDRCRLCSVAARRSVVAFPAHGARRKVAELLSIESK